MTIKGIDVSRYNAYVDFERAKKSGVGFAILKIGSGVRVDNKFEQYYKAAKQAGVNVGGYWYLYARSIDSARKEARWCISCLKGKQFEYPIFLDFEDPSQSSLGMRAKTDIAIAFCQELESAGYYTGIYSMGSWFNSAFDMSRLKKYDLWVARWSPSGPGRGCAMWQYTNKGKWPGVANTGEGGVDSNICYVNYPEIIKNAGLNGFKKPAPAPKPTPKPAPKPVQKEKVVLYLNDGDKLTAEYVAEMLKLQVFKDDGTRKATDYDVVYVGGQGKDRFETAKYVINHYF